MMKNILEFSIKESAEAVARLISKEMEVEFDDIRVAFVDEKQKNRPFVQLVLAEELREGNGENVVEEPKPLMPDLELTYRIIDNYTDVEIPLDRISSINVQWKHTPSVPNKCEIEMLVRGEASWNEQLEAKDATDLYFAFARQFYMPAVIAEIEGVITLFVDKKKKFVSSDLGLERKNTK